VSVLLPRPTTLNSTAKYNTTQHSITNTLTTLHGSLHNKNNTLTQHRMLVLVQAKVMQLISHSKTELMIQVLSLCLNRFVLCCVFCCVPSCVLCIVCGLFVEFVGFHRFVCVVRCVELSVLSVVMNLLNEWNGALCVLRVC